LNLYIGIKCFGQKPKPLAAKVSSLGYSLTLYEAKLYIIAEYGKRIYPSTKL